MRCTVRSFLVGTLVLAAASPAMGQSGSSHAPRSAAPWSAVFGGIEFDTFTHAVRAPEGGFYLVGSHAVAQGDPRPWVVRIDSDGRTRWELTLDQQSGLQANAACRTAEGGLIVVGQKGFGPSEGWITKLARTGRVEWTKVYAGTGDQWFTTVERSPRGFFIGGFVEQGPFVHDACVLELDARGEIRWQRRFSGGAEEGVRALARTRDGVLACIASQSVLGEPSIGVPFSRPWMVRLDGEGALVWQKTFDVTGGDLLNDIVALEGGGFVAAGEVQASAFFGGDVWVVRFDDAGSVLWSRAWGDVEFFGLDSAARVVPDRDGGFVVAGSTGTTLGLGDDMLLQKVDAQGNRLWTRIYGGAGYDRGNAVARFRNGDLLLVGSLVLEPALGDAFATRLDGSGQVPGHCTIASEIVPNPWFPTIQVAEPEVAPTVLRLTAAPVDVSVTPLRTGRYLCPPQ